MANARAVCNGASETADDETRLTERLAGPSVALWAAPDEAELFGELLLGRRFRWSGGAVERFGVVDERPPDERRRGRRRRDDRGRALAGQGGVQVRAGWSGRVQGAGLSRGQRRGRVDDPGLDRGRHVVRSGARRTGEVELR